MRLYYSCFPKNTYFEEYLRTTASDIMHERVNFTKNYVAVDDRPPPPPPPPP